jgi:ribosomal protein S5
VEAYPLSSGGGVRAGRLMSVICRLAGLTDVGVKARAPRGARMHVGRGLAGGRAVCSGRGRAGSSVA